MIKNILSILIFIFSVPIILMGQESSEQEDFYAHFTKNNTIHNAHYLESWYESIQELLRYDSTKVNIVHIGDSHIQADYLTGETRRLMQNTFGNAGRGFVFPYQVANSNGSYDVKVEHEGNWDYCRILKPSDSCYVGLCGIKLRCFSPESRISFDFKSKVERNYFYTKFLLFHDSESPHIQVDSSFKSIRSENVTEYYFNEYQSELNLVAGDSAPRDIIGFSFENSKSGILYHSMGSNGANTAHLTKNEDFGLQLSGLNPNLVIISFGTNDAYIPTRSFSAAIVKSRYKKIIEEIRANNPRASILLTTPPDHYYRKKYPNPNQEQLVNAIFELATEMKVAVWDLYHIMGGKKSIVNWANNGYARKDLVHFTKTGYHLQGKLLYEALIRAYEEFVEYPKSN